MGFAPRHSRDPLEFRPKMAETPPTRPTPESGEPSLEPDAQAYLELRQLIGWQRWIELVHFGRIRMATRTELNDPRAIFLAIFLRPFLDMIMTKIGRRIAPMTAGARNTTSKMNVFDDFL